MNWIILSFVFVTFAVPAVTAYLLARKGGVWRALATIIMPFVCIFVFIEISEYWLSGADDRQLEGGAPMTMVVYVLYGFPSALISALIWDRVKKNTKKAGHL